MILTDNTSSNYTPAPAGSYPARCCRVVDLGTQQTEFQGDIVHKRKVLLAFEILDPEVHLEDGRPYLLQKRFTASLHEKSALRKDLVSWRGRQFTDDELRRFDLSSVLGAMGFISVVEVQRDGRTYANLATIMRMPKGLPTATPTEPLVHFDLTAPDWAIFDNLPQRLQEQIAQSPEYKAARQQPTSKPASATSSTPFDDMDDDLPSF
jgi:hypothetical protein